MDAYERIALVIRYLDEGHPAQPALADIAAHAGLSPFQLHRLFSAWAGITPKDFLQCLTLEHARELLREGGTVLDAAIDAGLSGPGRLHDLCVTLEAASPGELKSGGEGWTIRAGFADSPFGRCLIGESPRGICHLSFVDAVADEDTALAALRASWPRADVQRDDAAARRLARRIFAPPDRTRPEPGRAPLRAYVRGTAFQVRVWRALLAVPPGAVVSYGALAAALDRRGAARALGSAAGSNPLAYLIPCHRVIRETGALGGYRWGLVRKRAILAWEGAGRSPSSGGDEVPKDGGKSRPVARPDRDAAVAGREGAGAG